MSAPDAAPVSRSTPRGFGVDLATSTYYFVVRVNADESVTIIERIPAPDDDPATSERATDTPKAHISAYRWGRILEPVTQEFTARLRETGQRAGRWLKRETPLPPAFGKELTLLAWAIEEADPTLLPMMVANWRGLAPEERWWFYTTINATAGTPDHGKDRGWRQAIKIEFASNPVEFPPSALLVGPQEAPASPRRAPKRPVKPPRDTSHGMLRLFDQ